MRGEGSPATPGVRALQGPGRQFLPSYQGLDYNGTFARGISFGNRQNLVLNSRFNMQMNGVIGDGIEVQAALSDENIPIQPEGNTQQLSDISSWVFIQLKKGAASSRQAITNCSGPRGIS